MVSEISSFEKSHEFKTKNLILRIYQKNSQHDSKTPNTKRNHQNRFPKIKESQDTNFHNRIARYWFRKARKQS